MSGIDKDPWCCAGDKLRINIDGFDAGYINALRSARHLVRALSKDDALAVLDELITELRPYREQEALSASLTSPRTTDTNPDGLNAPRGTEAQCHVTKTPTQPETSGDPQ